MCACAKRQTSLTQVSLVKSVWLEPEEILDSSCTSLMVNLQLAVTKLFAVAITSFLLDGVCPEHSRHSVDKCPCLKLKNCSENYVWLPASFQKAVLIIH